MSTCPPVPRWRVVVPVKDIDLAKSRLRPPPGVSRRALAHAFALDTLTALVACVPSAQVLVVTGDPWGLRAAATRSLPVEPDPGAGLNAALLAGLARLERLHGPGPTAALLADLPALRPEDLAAALQEADGHDRAFVPDWSGSGTALLTAGAGIPMLPAFGTGSADRHARTAARIGEALCSLRADVDDEAGLARALRLGVGRHTRAVLHSTPQVTGSHCGIA